MKKIILLIMTVIALFTSANADNHKMLFMDLVKKQEVLAYCQSTYNNSFSFIYVKGNEFNLDDEESKTIPNSKIVENNNILIFQVKNRVVLEINKYVKKTKNGFLIELKNGRNIIGMMTPKIKNNTIELLPYVNDEQFKALKQKNPCK